MNKNTDRKILPHIRKLNPAWKLLFFVSLSLFAVIGLILAEARLIRNETEKAIADAANALAGKNRFAFSREILTPHTNPHISFIQRRYDVVAITEFRGSVFAATGAGLLELTADGEFVRRFNVAEGLPESELTALAVFGDELFIGTRSSGLIGFDGERFTAFRIKKRNAANITALFADSRTMLVGTLHGGLLEFDGNAFTELTFGETPVNHATTILKDGPELVIGTFSEGLFIRRADESWGRFASTDGLFSNRVVGLESHGNDIFVATDLGVSRRRNDDSASNTAQTFQNIFAAPLLNDLSIADDDLIGVTTTGDLFRLPLGKIASAPVKSSGGPQNGRFGRLRNNLLLYGTDGIDVVTRLPDEVVTERFFRPEDREISGNAVSAIAADDLDNIWLGNFRGGIDVVSASGKPLFYLETDALRAINFLQRNETAMLAGADGGAFRIGRDRKPTKLIESADPNRAASVNHIIVPTAADKPLTAIATTTGLTIESRGSRREFSTLNGLRSNSVFATVVTDDAIYAATMSGLAVIADDRVRQVLTASDSGLRNNWITALIRVNGRIFGGTYGGGVFELIGCCEVVPLTVAGEKVTVNPNALYADDSRIYAGTLDGLVVFDLATRRWSAIREQLPSATVLAVSGDAGFIYLGTTAGAVRIDKRFWLEE